jgi:WD40 repeat protein
LPGPFQWSTDGSVLIAGGGPGRVRSWDFDGSRAAPQWRFVASPPVGISPHPDGRRLIVYTQDRQTWLWDQQGEPTCLGDIGLIWRARNGAMPGERVVIGGAKDFTPGVFVFDADRGTFREPVALQGPHSIVGAAVLPRERLLLAAGDVRWKESEILLCEGTGTDVPFATAKVAAWTVAKSTGLVTCMDAATDGRRLAFGCVDGGMHVWGLSADGKERQVIASATTNGRVWSIDLSGDGRFVTAGIQDGSVLTWAVDEGVPQFLVPPRDRAARAYLADNDRLVLEFAPDGLVKLWDTRKPPAAVVFEVAPGDGAVVKDAVLLRCPDPGAGRVRAEGLAAMKLVTVSSDGWVRVWWLDGEGVVRRARERRGALAAHRPL